MKLQSVVIIGAKIDTHKLNEHNLILELEEDYQKCKNKLIPVGLNVFRLGNPSKYYDGVFIGKVVSQVSLEGEFSQVDDEAIYDSLNFSIWTIYPSINYYLGKDIVSDLDINTYQFITYDE